MNAVSTMLGLASELSTEQKNLSLHTSGLNIGRPWLSRQWQNRGVTFDATLPLPRMGRTLKKVVDAP